MVLKGSMSMDQRDKMIRSFSEDPDVTVFLMSLKAGGALGFLPNPKNLTHALVLAPSTSPPKHNNIVQCMIYQVPIWKNCEPAGSNTRTQPQCNGLCALPPQVWRLT